VLCRHDLIPDVGQKDNFYSSPLSDGSPSIAIAARGGDEGKVAITLELLPSPTTNASRTSATATTASAAASTTISTSFSA